MAESFLREVKCHDRGRSELVRDNGTCIRYIGLRQVDLESVKASGAEDPVDDLKLFGISFPAFCL